MKTPNKELVDKAYERGVQQHLKRIAESGSDLHGNYTPSEICDMMLDKVDLKKAESILVLYNIELLFALKKRRFSGRVTFFTQSQEKVEIASKILPNVEVEYIDKEENPLYHMENKWPDKFDIIIANPPYGGTDVQNLHIKFLDKSLDIVDNKNGKIVFVHPGTQFLNKGTGDSVNIKFEKFLSSITFFNGGAVFGIEKHIPISLTYIDFSKKKEGFIVDNELTNRKANLDKICQINLFNEYHFLPEIKNKVETKMKLDGITSCESSVIFKGKKSNGPFRCPNSPYVRLQVFQGSVDNSSRKKLWKNNFFVLTSKNQIAELPGNSEPTLWIEFDSLIEANNCINFFKTDFARFCLSLVKTDKNLRSKLHLVPKLDFTQEWTDKKLYAHFNITEEEQAFIKEVIPPYYD
jgi:predicted RNA methylase